MRVSRIKHIIIFWITILFILQDGFAQSSVLSDGLWHRIDVRNDGIYRIRYEDLLSRGVLQNPVPSSRIALFGGPNGALPLFNRSGETFDLQEIAILVIDNGSGTFGAGSYILFYGQSPSSWIWNSIQRRYTFHMNVFTDEMAYFLTTDYLVGTRKRLTNKSIEPSPATLTITEFQDHYRYEKDEVNPFKSSQEWYGERLDPARPNLTIDLNLPGLVISKPVNVRTRLVINEPARVEISNPSNPTRTLSRSTAINDWMVELLDEFSWTFTNASPSISFAYTRLSNNPSWAHLDYLELHYRRQLSFIGNAPFQFRFVDSETSEIGEFRISSANSTSRFWDISNPLEPQIIQGTLSGNTFSFTSSLSRRSEFIGFSESSVTSITQFEPIKNQNFHGVDSVEYVIVVHPLFRSEAERLAEFHRNRNLNVLVVTPTEVFNEFSFGRQDPMAIRRMMRHYRNKALAQGSDIVPKYLLLFGSPSYDYRDRTNQTGQVQNFVLNYQFPTGLRESESFSTDDMFGFLADGETGLPSPGNTDRLAIGIGRFPARTLEQARTLVDKTISYVGPKFGDWRNVVANLADDGDNGVFVKIFESTHNSRVYFENDFRKNFREINIDKIYFDAFPQVATPSGARFPAAKEALIRRIERGTLLLNYQGHSGEVRLADEDILNVSDIQNLQNIDQLMVFFTASCSFSRYDNPDLISGGEWSVISPKGGAVVQIGTSRIAWASPNDTLHGLFNHLALMRDNNGNARSLSECMRLAKNASNNLRSLQQFVLLGDPAISLALPQYKVITTHINDNPIENGIDTIRALDYASISGKIVDFNNNFLSDFNGEVSITVFDKPTQVQTLGQKNSTSSHNNPVISYNVQENALFRGRIPVINGEFNVQFMAPKDINYNYGFGKISYYAYSDSADATGVFDSVVIGGFGEFFGDSADPPVVRLFLNDTNFRNGNIATSNPILLAKVSDKYGINYTGAGIGHNISLVINDDFRRQIYLNEFFEELPSGPNGEMRGEIRYPMFNLLPGAYNLKLKVWNVFNISTEASLDFNVVQSDKPIIGQAFCFPNPMIDHTKFYFTHNAPQKIKRVEIDIFDMSGRWMVRLSKNVNPDGFAIDPIEWNTRDANGHKLRQGLYLYRLRIVLEDGRMAEKTEKLVIGGG